MDQISASEVRATADVFGAMPDDQLSAFATAAIAALASALSGEAKDCACDVCCSMRGLMIGIQANV